AAAVAAAVVPVVPAEPAAVPAYPPSSTAVRRLVERLAPRYQIDPALALAIIAVESGFRPNAVSPRNAQGLMQLIPDTARRFGVVDAFDPESNVRGGMAYLRWLLVRFNNDVRLVAAAYNAGENAVRRHGGVPPFPETRAYVQRIASLYSTPVHAYRAPAPAAAAQRLPTAFPGLPSSRLSATSTQN
ncbi:lytic transglycosylase domain-containing protein, partial [Pseudoduganella buxea]